MNMFEGIILILLMNEMHCYSLLDSGYIYSGIVWNDTDGKSIEAHTVGIIHDPVDNSYWWHGVSPKTTNLSYHGVSCYHSKDLINWTNMGRVLSQKDVIVKDLRGPYIIERPKVLWNALTKRYVMWFHLDSAQYKYRHVGVATSPIANGTFTFVGAFQPDGIPSLDMNLFLDKVDGIVKDAYFIRSYNNQYVGIIQLTDDYLNTTGIVSRIDEQREGMTIFHRNNHYYMMTSHLSGYNPNEAELFMSDRDSLGGTKWISLGNPTHSGSTFNSQCAFVRSVPSTKYSGDLFYIYMDDRWNFPHLLNATYIWLPFQFHSDTNITIQWQDKWSLSDY